MTDFIDREVAGYQLLEMLGDRHGLATYKAAPPDGGASVAIKFFPSEVARNRQLLLLLRDAMRAVARMNHPAIPPILGSGIHNGRPYIITPFISAGSLLDRIEFGTTGALDAGQVFTEIANALEYAHARGVVHGNLKPSNVLFNEDGRVQITDLGQAKILRSPELATLSDPYDKEPFLAPEVFAGQPMTPSSDQYSLGLLVLEMLTGYPATDALRFLQNPYQRSFNHPSGPRQINISIPPQLADVLARALAEDPTQRFNSIAEMKRALAAALGMEASPDKAAEPIPKPARKPRRGNKRALLFFATTLAMMLCLIITMPALSSAWKGIEGSMFFGGQATATIPGEVVVQTITVLEPVQGGESTTSEIPTEVPHGDTYERISPSNTIAPTRVMPTKVEATSEELPSEATETQEPTYTLTVAPTATFAPSNTVPPSPTPTEEPPPTPSLPPTIKPETCKDKPDHPHYCTPTP